MEEPLTTVARLCLPSAEQEQELQARVAVLLQQVQGLLDELRIAATPMLVGSVPKGTFLRAPDIDLFVAFPVGTSEADLASGVERIAARLLQGRQKRYAQHPYAWGWWRAPDEPETVPQLEVEVVPCYAVESPTAHRSAVDRTPFHTRYVQQHLPSERRTDVRFFKAWLKGIGCYGAEVAIQGISGYLAELLVLRYGDFEATVAAIAAWRLPLTLTLGPVAAVPKEDVPLVMVDPVDARRNAAAALSWEQAGRLRQAARDYLAAPDLRFFFPPLPPRGDVGALQGQLQARGCGVVALQLPLPPLVPDVYWSQLHRVRGKVAALLQREGFALLGARAAVSEDEAMATILWEVLPAQLPASVVHPGPPVGRGNEEEFLAKWQGHPRALGPPMVVEGRWQVTLERPRRTPLQVLEAETERLELGKDLTPLIRQRGRWSAGADAVRSAPDQLAQLWAGPMPWRWLGPPLLPH